MDLPEAVRSYLLDEDIGTAVDALAGIRTTVPARVGWGEMPAYYEAVGAALQVKAMYAVAVERLWRAVWGEAVRELEPADPDDDIWHAQPNSVEDCWSNSEFGRSFRIPGVRPGPSWLCTDVGLERHEVNISAFISGLSGKKLLARLPGFRQAATDDWVYFVTGRLLGTTDVLPELQDHARTIVRIARGD